MIEKTFTLEIDISAQAKLRRKADAIARRVLDASSVLAVTTLLAGLLVSIAMGNGPTVLSDIMEPRSLVARLFWSAMVGSAFLVYRLASAGVQPNSLRPSNGKVRVERCLQAQLWQLIDSTPVLAEFALLAALLKKPQAFVLFLRSEVPIRELLDALEHNVESESNIEAFHAILVSAARSASERSLRSIGIDEFLGAILVQPRVQEFLSQWPEASEYLLDSIRWAQRWEALASRARQYKKRAGWLPKGPMNITMTATATPFLDLVSRDLTESAKRGGFQPLLGRDKEFTELNTLLQGHERHVVVVGHPGVGKTSFFMELAQRIVEGRVPNFITDQRLLSVDPGRVLAGATRPGELEMRFQQLVAEVSRARNVILLFEEIDQWIGMGTGQQSLDVVDELLRTIERSPLVVFSTTSVGQWTQSLEKKSGFVSVFHRFDLNELSRDGAQEVLEAHALSRENRLGVLVSVPAIREAVSASARLMHDRFLPEKALQILDESMSHVSPDQKPLPLVTKQVVDETVERITHVPIGQVGGKERDLLLHLEENLSRQIVGQTQAIAAVSNALRRSRAQVEDRSRPIANLLFVGPTGVGKTLIAKTVAKALLGQAMNMVRLDMSEYQAQASIDRFLGVPGGGRGGVVTEALRSSPYALLLLDELEKAHPKILTILLQLMDEGRVTDVTGRTIDTTNVLLIATSNAATPMITQAFKEGQTIEAIRKELLGSILPTIFPPEFINRFDDIIIFEPLTQPQIETIAGLELAKIQTQLLEKGIHVEFPPPTVRWIAQIGFNQQYGARPLRRAIQDSIENVIARSLIEGTLKAGSHVRVLPNGVLESVA